MPVALAQQYAAGLLIGLGTGGVVGASTLGVAIFTLIAPRGELREFTAVVPIVNCCANIATVSNYFKHAELKTCMRMWPWLFAGIGLGTVILPLLEETLLRRATSVVYALVLLQQIVAKLREKPVAPDEDASKKKIQRDETAALYASLPMTIGVSLICGVLTVVCNNSGPVFNVYLLSLGMNMDQFVATRAVLMAGKNVAKVSARALTRTLTMETFVRGCKIGLTTVVGIFLAKPIKKRTSPQFYKYFTWLVLAYTSVKMWQSSS